MTEQNPAPQSDNNSLADYGPSKLLAALKAQAEAQKPAKLPLKLPRKNIRQEPSLFQPRDMNERHISDLVGAIKMKRRLEPVTVIQVGHEPILIDGHHRMTAYKRANVDTDIPVKYFKGSLDDAVLEAGNANSRAKLPMTNQDRQNYAWRLVLLDRFVKQFSKQAICNAAGVSNGQVAIMRRIARTLNGEAFECKTWGQALRTAQGSARTFSTDDELKEFKESQARDYAERLSKAFYNKLTGNPEIAAMALEMHFGGKLRELHRWLEERVENCPDDDEDSEFENDDF